MTHFIIAKLFFIIFSAGLLICHADEPTTRVSSVELNGTKCLQLSCSGTSKLAIFLLRENWYLVWDCGNQALDLVIPKADYWPSGFRAIEQIKNISSSRPCIIFALNISPGLVPIATNTEKGWTINALPERIDKDNTNAKSLAFESQRLGHFQIANLSDDLAIQLDMPTGEELTVTPTPYLDSGLEPLESDYVCLYRSTQGVCLYLKSDQFVAKKQGDAVGYSPVADPLLASEQHRQFNKMAPPNTTFIQPGDFRAQASFLLLEKAVNDPKNRALHLLRKAWVEITLAEGNEARQTALFLAKEDPEVMQTLHYKLILGFAEFLSQNYYESLEILKPLPNTPEVEFWRNLSKIQLGERPLFNESILIILKNYPQNLRDYILVKLIPYLFEASQTKLLRSLHQTFVGVNSRQGGIIKAVMDFYYAMYVFTHESKSHGLKLLEPIASDQAGYVVPTEFQTEAYLEIYLFKHENDSPETIIKELDTLRSQSRGCDIELRTSLKLIDQLAKQHDYSAIIELLQDLIPRFNKFDVKMGLTQRLNGYLQNFFLQEDSAQVSPVKQIALFRKYKPLIEGQAIYEKIAERVAHQYGRIDLLDQEADLLLELSKTTLDHEKKIELQLKVGNIYLQNLKPEAAIALLANIYTQIAEKHQQAAARILANAENLRKNYSESIGWLKLHPSKENKRMIADIYIETQDFPSVISALKEYLASLNDKEDDELKEVGLVQLAAAYYLQKESSSLNSLHETHKDFMAPRKSKQRFEMLCRPRAEDLKTSQEVREYINDADVLKEIFEQGKDSIG